MNGTWKDLFAFNKRERNGIFVLSILIVFLLALQLIMPFFEYTDAEIDLSFEHALNAKIKEDAIQKEILAQQRKDSIAFKKSHFKIQDSKDSKRMPDLQWAPKPMDPNTANLEDWMSFGLSQRQVQSIINYQSKGGSFRTKKDVQKMFVISDELFLKMEPYIFIAEIKWSNPVYDSVKAQPVVEVSRIELNTTDTLELIKLKGIGSYYARQIIYYRDRLGGFYSVNQLYEIENMRAETVQKILPFINVDEGRIIMIHINSESAPVMVKHPYITWNMAINIQDYRDFTHKFKSTRQLVDLGLLNEEIYSKLVPYLEL